MSKYINAEWLIKESMPLSFSVQKWVNEVQIMTAPSIDIIKCKECIYYEALGYDAPKDGWCNSPKLYCDGYWVDEDDFCSDAKKEETNES